MCGIAGFIGVSKDYSKTYELITALFHSLESRGKDASGVWGTCGDTVVYHKEPICSSLFVKTSFWTDVVKNTEFDLLLLHARQTSLGSGLSYVNKNNHPFVNDDCSLAMIHNGTLTEARYIKEVFKTDSRTDSEVLLRIFEKGRSRSSFGHNEENLKKLSKCVPDYILQYVRSIRDIWSVVYSGSMAVAFGEILDKDHKLLCLFRNEKRPLWLVDLRETLGQLFFFSTMEVWNGMIDCISWDLYNSLFDQGKHKTYCFPDSEAWIFDFHTKDGVVDNDNIYRFSITLNDKSYRHWDDLFGINSYSDQEKKEESADNKQQESQVVDENKFKPKVKTFELSQAAKNFIQSAKSKAAQTYSTASSYGQGMAGLPAVPGSSVSIYDDEYGWDDYYDSSCGVGRSNTDDTDDFGDGFQIGNQSSSFGEDEDLKRNIEKLIDDCIHSLDRIATNISNNDYPRVKLEELYRQLDMLCVDINGIHLLFD